MADDDSPAKTLKTLAEAIEGLSKLEGELQQQLAKADGELRHQVAIDLANTIGARIKLVKDRAAQLQILSPSPVIPPPSSPPPSGSSEAPAKDSQTEHQDGKK